MDFLKEIYREIRNKIKVSSPPYADVMPFAHVNQFDAQLEKTLGSAAGNKVFLIAPFGAGKTTQLCKFFHKRPHLDYVYRSFAEIHSLDVAFLHIVPLWSRALFILGAVSLAVLLIRWIPQLGSVPLLLVLVGLFARTFGDLIYLLHHATVSVFRRRPKVIVIEDLEKSSLSASDQFVFLSSLWKYKAIYLVTMGYSGQDKKGALSVMELTVKLKGTVIELPVEESMLHEMMKRLDPQCPFLPPAKEDGEQKGWLSQFTFREIEVVHQQVMLRGKKRGKLHYIDQYLRLLMDKLGIANHPIFFDENSQEIKNFSEEGLSEEQKHYLHSFLESIAKEAQVKELVLN